MPEYDIDYMCFDIKTQSLVQILGATTSLCTSSGKLKKSKYAGKVVLTSYPFISIEEEYADPLIDELIKRNMDVVRNVNQKHVFLRKAHHVSTKVLVRALQACGVQNLRYVNFGTKMPVQDFRDMLEPHIVGDTFVVDVGTALPEGRHKDGYFTLFQPVERPDYRGRVTSDWAGFQAHITPHQMFLTEFGGFELDMKHVYDNVGKGTIYPRLIHFLKSDGLPNDWTSTPTSNGVFKRRMDALFHLVESIAAQAEAIPDVLAEMRIEMRFKNLRALNTCVNTLDEICDWITDKGPPSWHGTFIRRYMSVNEYVDRLELTMARIKKDIKLVGRDSNDTTEKQITAYWTLLAAFGLKHHTMDKMRIGLKRNMKSYVWQPAASNMFDGLPITRAGGRIPGRRLQDDFKWLFNEPGMNPNRVILNIDMNRVCSFVEETLNLQADKLGEKG